jgi:hypothetical protein
MNFSAPVVEVLIDQAGRGSLPRRGKPCSAGSISRLLSRARLLQFEVSELSRRHFGNAPGNEARH